MLIVLYEGVSFSSLTAYIKCVSFDYKKCTTRISTYSIIGATTYMSTSKKFLFAVLPLSSSPLFFLTRLAKHFLIKRLRLHTWSEKKLIRVIYYFSLFGIRRWRLRVSSKNKEMHKFSSDLLYQLTNQIRCLRLTKIKRQTKTFINMCRNDLKKKNDI